MDYKKTKASTSTITRDSDVLEQKTGNFYEAVSIMSKRSNQISTSIKHELTRKLEEFANYTDNLEEIFENREQIEISKYFERLPKSTLIAVQEWEENKIYYKSAIKSDI